MGDRGQVHIKDEGNGKGVWLYTHWGASDLVEVVQAALAKKWRWNDPDYLARIIFDEMIGANQGDETGFGIASDGPHGDEWRIIEIDCKGDSVTVLDNEVVVIKTTFEDFLTAVHPAA